MGKIMLLEVITLVIKGGIMKTLFIVFLALFIVSCGEKGSADQLFTEGAKYIEQGQYDKAIELYQRGIKVEPKSAMGYNLLGMAYRFKFNQTGEQMWRDKEIESFEKAIELAPDFAVALINLGATYYYSGEKQKAAPYFKHALEVYPQHPEAEEIKQMIAEIENLQKDK
jgi:tetratricopeptide (TPR) repeat protein